MQGKMPPHADKCLGDPLAFRLTNWDLYRILLSGVQQQEELLPFLSLALPPLLPFPHFSSLPSSFLPFLPCCEAAPSNTARVLGSVASSFSRV